MLDSFNPTIDEIKRNKKNILQKSVDSLNMMMPTRTEPTAPIPAQTAYAVPIGKVLAAKNNRYILIETLIKKPNIHNVKVVPDESFALLKQLVKATSNKPPSIR